MYRNILDNACFKDCLAYNQKKSSKNSTSRDNLLKDNPLPMIKVKVDIKEDQI